MRSEPDEVRDDAGPDENERHTEIDERELGESGA